MMQFMTETVITTAFVFIMTFDAWMCFKGLRWLWNKIHKK